jgi:phosphatidate cytidylyltransferase
MIDDRELLALFGGILGALIVATAASLYLRVKADSSERRALAEDVFVRTRSWWTMCAIFAVAVLTGGLGSILLFALVSFLALREFITVVPTARADHRALFWLFFVIVPAQYWLVWIGWYGLFVVLIPVHAFLFLPVRMVIEGDCQRFLERASKIQWGLMACVYCVSHAPAILMLDLPNHEGETAKLLLYLVVVVEFCDVAQYVWGKSLGRRKIMPTVSPGKTWVGFVGGCLTAAALGAGLWWATPFSPLSSFAIALGVSVLGFCGDVTMSAIKRDSQIKDYGTLLPGHGGVLDRIDSLCFAAPFFFHVVRYGFGSGIRAEF